MPRVIDTYLSEFDRHLAFDPKLARRVRDEIGSHLAEAAEQDGDEANAVARFGDPKLLSKSFVESALPGRLRTTSLWLAILAAVTFMLMRLRSIWFDLGADREGLFADLTKLDRTGFALGLILAGYAWWTIRRSVPDAGRAVILMHAAMLSFAISIAASLARAYIVAGPNSLIGLTGALETICLGALYWQLRVAFRHAQITQAASQSGE